MKNSNVFKKKQIAPCGMNCGTCIAFLRSKNNCPGCREISEDKALSVKKCKVTNCDHLKATKSKFCFECEKFPCARIKQLDKRYKTKYHTSFIENLQMIKQKGLEDFLSFESKRRTCRNCGSVLCVHRSHCLTCMKNAN
jgi:hypothetical protein